MRGGEQAAKENFIEGLVVDVVASALVAAAGAALFPAVAAAELWSGAWFAFNAGASVASRVGGSFGADTIARPNETGLAGFDGEIDAKLAAMSQFGQSADAFQVPDAGALEKEIWYAWISQLSDDEVPDQDEIQHHLVSLGIIPDYFYMTDEDQHRAVAEARQHMAAAPRQAHPPADQ